MAHRDATHRGHLVLVETLTEIAGVLPRASEGAAFSRAEIFRKFPALFGTWLSLVLEPKLLSRAGSERNLREAKTLVKMLDDADDEVDVAEGERLRRRRRPRE